jgi:hypothetical protein
VEQLQKDCVNKRRRQNLPKESIEVMSRWFSEHSSHPYPTEQDKKALAAAANLREDQVNNWFVNVRKRYWRPSN